MQRTLSAALLACTAATPALAQRAQENVVTAAADAFGTSVGNEKIGLYNTGDVRGFNPSTAGNVRIEGIAVTEHGGFFGRLAAASTIRVGLTAQGYPFPAPTGIADYTLRNAGDEAVLSPIVYLGPNRTAAIDLDAQLPIVPGRLSLAAGVSYRYEEAFPGEDSRTTQGAAILRWRPNARVAATAFYGRFAVDGDRDIANIFVAGPYLPPRIARRYFGLDWTQTAVARQFYGALATARVSEGWDLRGGLFRSGNHVELNPVELYRNLQPDGSGQRSVATTRDQRAESTSGELRSSHSLIEGGRRHTLHLMLRGRETVRALGGADVRALGPAVIGRPAPVPEPAFAFGRLTHDRVRQMTGGVSYELRWPGVGEVSFGVQKTDYDKITRFPDRPALIARDNPWLYNAMGALYLSERLVAYAGYTRGLEDSAIAPADAVNRDLAPPALRTSQRDAGVRFTVRPGLTLVAGLFDVRKPYFNTDPARVYRELGTVRHRGVELSFTGQPVPGLSLVAGAVFLDARVTGDAVRLGVIGPKPVGVAPRTVRVNLDYRVPSHPALSVDLGMTSLSGKVASPLVFAALGDRQLRSDGRTTFDLGARYRFQLGGAPATVRVQVTNLFDRFAWDVGGNAAFKFIDERRASLNLAVDL